MGVHDLVVIGQGAAGLTAALYAARYKVDVVVVGEQLGGETALASSIENYPGAPSANGLELMIEFRKQVEQYRVPILDERVEAVSSHGDGWQLRVSNEVELQAASLIFAHGRRRRVFGLPHEAEWTGKGISYCSTCDAPLNRDKVVGVVGGGSAAVEGALLNAQYAKQVYLIYRGSKLTRPEPILIDLLGTLPNVKVLFQTEVIELTGDDEAGLRGVRLSRASADSTEHLALDTLFVEIGAEPLTELPVSIGVGLNAETGEVHVDRLMGTSVPGVFAAGDLTDGSGPMKQTVTAAAQGAVAAMSAYHYLTRRSAADVRVGEPFAPGRMAGPLDRLPASKPTTPLRSGAEVSGHEER